MKTKYFIPIIFLLLFTRCSTNSNADLKNFPEGYTPEEVGTRISKRFISGKHMLHKKNGKDGIHYAEVCTWYGALKYAVAVGDNALIKQLQNKFEPLFTTEANYQPLMNHVDLNMFGCLPFEFYQITKDQRYYDMGLPYADTQWQVPDTATTEEKNWARKGFSWQTRLWIDDMFMITIIQSQAYKATGKREYIDRAAREMVMYLDELQHPPIGFPCENTRITLVEGEICVSGTCLSAGYYNAPEKTAAAFVQHPDARGIPERMYKTGDLGAYNERGELMFLGRKDSQIKKQGYRIELGEIECAIKACQAVTQGCCFYQAATQQIVCCYSGEDDEKALRGELRRRLPKYMLPDVYYHLPQFPQTMNGKIDRVRLRQELGL